MHPNRLQRVSLNDVPLRVRMKALAKLTSAKAPDLELLTLALCGSDRTHLVSAEAAEKVLGRR